MKKLVQIPLAVAIVSLALAGCAGKDHTESVKPSKLPKIQVTQTLKQVFALNGDDSPKYDPLRLQLAEDQGIYYSVSPKGTVQAYQNGKKLWQQQLRQDLRAGVTATQGIVVVGGKKGQLTALDGENGKVVWSQNLDSEILNTSAIGQNRVITVGNDGTVYAHDLATGQQIWTYNLPMPSFSVRGYAAPVLLDDQRTVAIANADGFVYAFDSVVGVPVWKTRVAFTQGRNDIQKLIDVDGQPRFIDQKMVTVSYQGQVSVTDLTRQQVIWSQKASSLNSPAVDQQHVYVAQDNGTVTAYDLQTGEERWSNQQLAYRQLSNPVILDNLLIVGDMDGVLHLLDPNSGQLLGREKVKGAVRTLQVKNQALYVATTDGQFSIWQKP